MDAMEGVRGLVGGIGVEGEKRVSVGFTEEGRRMRSGGWGNG